MIPTFETRAGVGQILNHVLADEFALSAATRDYHWNVTGPQFRCLQELFDEQYRQLDRWSERIGERVRALGVAAKTGWRELVQARRFRPAPGAGLSADQMMAALIALHEYLAQHLQRDKDECAEQFGDGATAELLAELAEYHDTTAWMLGELMTDRERAEA
ncbi:MAG TPA: DNA starvation/stationary phase protection protein [Opitutus sp.]|nr:DNA starvation/stationary phase protection protein [Opitutus sp.]